MFGFGIEGSYNICCWTTGSKEMNKCILIGLNNYENKRAFWW